MVSPGDPSTRCEIVWEFQINARQLSVYNGTHSALPEFRYKGRAWHQFYLFRFSRGAQGWWSVTNAQGLFWQKKSMIRRSTKVFGYTWLKQNKTDRGLKPAAKRHAK